MAWPTSSFPTTLDTITDKVDNVDNASASDINGAYDCIEKLEMKVGADGSAVTTSLDYLVKNPLSVDPGHKHSDVENLLHGATSTPAANKTAIRDSNAMLKGCGVATAINSSGTSQFSSGHATSFTSIDLSSYIPSTAKYVYGCASVLNQLAYLSPTSNGSGYLTIHPNTPWGYFRLPLLTAQTLWYRVALGDGSLDIKFMGYEE